MQFLLDTNIVSELIRNPRGPLSRRVDRIAAEDICTSIIVTAELRYGAAKKQSPRLAVQLEEVLAGIKVVSLDPPVDSIYGELRAYLESTGKLIGPNDLLIAAQTLALNCTLVTDNIREFSRVKNLRIENWLR